MGCCGDKVPGEVLVTLDLDWATSRIQKVTKSNFGDP